MADDLSTYDFATNEHRRALAHLRDDFADEGFTPDTLGDLARRLADDPYAVTPGAPDEAVDLETLVEDLRAEGFLTVDEEGRIARTERGNRALQAGIVNEPPPTNPVIAKIQAAEDAARNARIVRDELARSIEETAAYFEEAIGDARERLAAAEAELSAADASLDKVNQQYGGK